MSISISFHRLNNNSFKIRRCWRNWLTTVIKKEDVAKGHICIIFCDDEYLSGINRKYLNNNNLTDVITFNYDEKVLNGDVFISIERVEENSQKYKVSFQNELCRVMVHGLLHLLGYKDNSKKEKAEMRAKEDEYLILLQKRFT